jgi:hypothetical protein
MFSKMRKMISPKKKTKTNDISYLKNLNNIDNKQLFLTIISSILSDLIYIDCDYLIDKPILISLGLTVKYCYISENTTKFMVFAKATNQELEELQNSMNENENEIEQMNYIKNQYDVNQYNDYKFDADITSSINLRNIKRTIKYNEITKSFIKPYYSPNLIE